MDHPEAFGYCLRAVIRDICVCEAAASAASTPVVTTVDELRNRLAGARTATADLAVTSDGYRAGLLGSITASLATLVEVQLG